MFKLLRILSLFLLALPIVTGGILGCSRESSKSAVQGSQPDLSAAGTAATDARNAAARALPGEPPPSGVNAVEAKVPEASKIAAPQVATIDKPVDTRLEPVIGMSPAQVKASNWGEPIDDVGEEVVEGIVHTWHYEGNRAIKFNHAGVVTEITR